jgi:hypothetical protein
LQIIIILQLLRLVEMRRCGRHFVRRIRCWDLWISNRQLLQLREQQLLFLQEPAIGVFTAISSRKRGYDDDDDDDDDNIHDDVECRRVTTTIERQQQQRRRRR